MSDSSYEIEIIGGGLAGCEAAWRAANRGAKVRLWEMKPHRFSPAHKLNGLAELVCSNSLRAAQPENAVGLLKEEMRRLGSLTMAVADRTSVPAGGALAVDRELFSQEVTKEIEAHPGIDLIRAEVTAWPKSQGPVIIAGGPLASDALVALVDETMETSGLNFYDALAPIVSYDSLDLEKAYLANRYEQAGQGDYLNCPLTREEFDHFLAALLAADEVEPRPFEEQKYFEGCLPIEVMARRGPRTLTFGPMKPVGLELPHDGGSAEPSDSTSSGEGLKTCRQDGSRKKQGNPARGGRRPFAVVQLRRENVAGTAWNLVGFQTRLTRPAQERVFRLIPGLEKAEFLRFGAIHRNTYLDAPKVLDDFQRLKSKPGFFVAGQFAGVEGYVESAAHGLWVGENVFRSVRGYQLLNPPTSTALGALLSHLKSDGAKREFSPANVNFGLFDPLPETVPKNARSKWRLDQARRTFADFLAVINL